MSISTESVELLNNRISEAKSALSDTFGETKIGRYGTLDYFDLADLTKAYQKEDVFTKIAEQLSSFGKEIRKMRSSYLPIDLAKDVDGMIKPELSNDIGHLESYENAFMRMLGLPDSEDILLSGGAAILTVSRDGIIGQDGTIPKFVEEGGVFSERAKNKSDRIVVVNNYIYDDSKTDETGAKIYPKINTLENNIFYFSHLFFPPIQDSRFSKCINEPTKMVAPPFSSRKGRTVNSTTMKPTLLESIIRIRVDSLSGQEVLVNLKFSEDEEPDESTIGGILIDAGTDDEKSVNAYAENFGIMEALFILRLRAALSGLAKKFAKDRSDINEAVALYNKSITEAEDPDPDGTSGSTNDSNAAETKATDPENFHADTEKFLSGEKIRRLNASILIEDSIMALFGNSSEALDLQVGTQRNSSIKDAHLMSGLFGIIDIPRKRMAEQVIDLNKKIDDSFVSNVEPIRGDINSVIGTDIGIGNLDMIVFALALFTMSEFDLLDLLSDAQFERLKESSVGSLEEFTASRGSERRINAINELSKLVYAGYELFVSDIKNTDKS